MSIPTYRFLTHWRVLGTPEEVFAILEDPRDLPRWWPSVYLAAQEIERGGEDGVGRTVALLTKGWLPYTLGWVLEVAEARRPSSLTVQARGDLTGRGVWTLESAGAWVAITFEWSVEARKPLLRALSPLFSPILAANHRWAMRRGEESLILELARRRAGDVAQRARIPPPPSPARFSGRLLLAGAVVAVWLGLVVWRRTRRRPRLLSGR